MQCRASRSTYSLPGVDAQVNLSTMSCFSARPRDSSKHTACRSSQTRLDLVLPNPDDLPTHAFEQPVVEAVATPVRRDLEFPFLGKLVPPLTEIPPMPEVAVDEDHDLAFSEHEIRPAREVSCMALPDEPTARESTSQKQFRAGVPTTNPRHHARAGFRRHDIAPVRSLSSDVRRCPGPYIQMYCRRKRWSINRPIMTYSRRPSWSTRLWNAEIRALRVV
jgi:hypothetical protein